VAHLSTWLRTVRHLRPVQIYARVWFRLSRPRVAPRPPPVVRAKPDRWTTPARRSPSLESPSRARFLNSSQDLASVGWDSPELAKLWRYNLHYFDDLNALGAPDRAAWHGDLIDRWIAENPPTRGTGWEPYPTSLRIANWIKWSIARKGIEPHVAASLAHQVRWLRRRLEWHLLGNHLFANAKALVMAGLFFEGEEATQWVEEGSRIVSLQLDEQVLADGGHFERSTMYHELFLEDLLDLLNAHFAYGRQDAPLAAKLREIASRMLVWSRAMRHPDCKIAFFNDSAHGIAPDPREIERYAQDLGLAAAPAPANRLTDLAASGYVRVERDNAVVLMDLAAVGPDYLLGHAHADTLSFELSVGTERIIVNGGTSVYGMGATRYAERGTAAHSTVVVDGKDSSEVWSGFRVGRRAGIIGRYVSETTVDGSHDGYMHLPGRPIVSRRWQFGSRSMSVADTVTGGKLHAVARFQMGSGLQLQRDGDEWLILRAGSKLAKMSVSCGSATITKASYAPEFGLHQPIECLEVVLQDGRACTFIEW
jgi:uncharacterized heparinase superfamily protein